MSEIVGDMEVDEPSKYFDTSEVVHAVVDTPGTCFPRSISLVPKGTSNNRRCGKSIKVHSIEWNGILIWRFLADVLKQILTPVMRIVLVRQKNIDQQFATNGPPFLQVFQNTYILGNSSHICSQINWDYKQDYEVLFDEMYNFDQQAGQYYDEQNKNIVTHIISGKVELDPPREIRYTGYDGTPFIEDVLAGHLFWYFIDHINDTYSKGEVNLLSTRITFDDQ